MEALIDDATFKEAFQRKADKLPEELKLLVTDVTFIVDETVKIDRKSGGVMPVITGNLQGSMSIDNLSDYSKRIYPDLGIAPYAEAVILGSKPHDIVITPKNAKALLTPYGFYKKVVVHHPGTEGYDFLSAGVEKAQPAVDARLEEFKSWIMEG